MDNPARDLGRIQESPPQDDQQTNRSHRQDQEEYLAAARREEIKDSEQDRAQRKHYSSRLYWLVVGWLTAVGGLLLLDGFSAWGFALSEVVLATLIGTTTASMLGVLTIVIRYLFPHR